MTGEGDPRNRRRRLAVIDLQIPFFRPLWRRVAFALLLFVWTVFELVAGSPWWAALVGGILVYALRELFFVFDPPDGKPTPRKEE